MTHTEILDRIQARLFNIERMGMFNMQRIIHLRLALDEIAYAETLEQALAVVRRAQAADEAAQRAFDDAGQQPADMPGADA